MMALGGNCTHVTKLSPRISPYNQEIPEDNVYDYGLWDLNRILVGIGRSLANFPPMPLPQQQ